MGKVELCRCRYHQVADAVYPSVGVDVTDPLEEVVACATCHHVHVPFLRSSSGPDGFEKPTAPEWTDGAEDAD